MQRSFLVSRLLLATLSSLCLHHPALAQIQSDGTTATQVNSANGLNFAIDGGAAAGRNLFHSFSQFSIPTDGSGSFNNALDVQNIFARVTGSNVTNIDGVLSASGNANLFLLNPNGVVFGANARLNLGGALLTTTATSFQFADGTEFSASTPTPLLTMSVPIGLQMGENPGAITIQGNGHRLSTSDSLGFAPLVQPTRSGLQLRPGQSLTLVGNNINFDQGVVGAAQGQLAIGSVTGGFVGFQANTPGRLDYSRTTGFGDINLTGRSLLDVSGMGAGAMQLQGRQISLQNGSVLLSQNFGLPAAGELQITATERLFVNGTTADAGIRSGISSETLGPGAGSPIVITAPMIQVQQGANIFTKSFNQNLNRGVAGDVQVNASQLLQLEGFVPRNPTQISTIGSGTLGAANSGNLKIVAGKIELLDGAALATTSFGAGASGQITVNADRIAINRVSGLGAPSTLGTTSFKDGNSGSLTINSRRLTLTDGGTIAATGYGRGNAGSILLNVTEAIDLSGFTRMFGEISSSSINSSVLAPTPVFQRLLNLVDAPTGSAGTLEINTPSLALSNGSITVRNVGAGQGGTLLVNADQIRLSQTSRLSAQTASGLGGEVDLRSNLLTLRQNSSLIATAGNRGDGGNIKINAPLILGLENSDIVANALLGRGGNIQITTQGLIGLQNRPQLTPASDITASSELGVNGTVQVDNLGVDPNSGLLALPIDVVDPSQQIARGCAPNPGSSLVLTGRGGMPPNPIRQTETSLIWADLRPTNTFTTAVTPERSANPIQEATEWIHHPNTGQIEILVTQTLPKPTHIRCVPQLRKNNN
jgi:filamentous hemagglutinin family protein